MTYLRDRAQQGKKTVYAFLAVIFLVVLFLFRVPVFTFLSPLGAKAISLFYSISEPLVSLFTPFTSRSLDAIDLASENELLRNQAALVPALEERIRFLETDLLLSSQSATGTLKDSVFARRIHIGTNNAYQTALFDAGTTKGVSAGSLVFSLGGTLLGTVLEVFETTSRVQLFGAPGNTIDAAIAGTSTPLTLEGTGPGTYIARVPQHTEFAVGDLVYARLYPNYHIGSITHISMKPQDPFMSIVVTTAENPYTLSRVRILVQP